MTFAVSRFSFAVFLMQWLATFMTVWVSPACLISTVKTSHVVYLRIERLNKVLNKTLNDLTGYKIN